MLLVWQTDIWNLFSRKPHNCHILETKFLHNCTFCRLVWSNSVKACLSKTETRKFGEILTCTLL